ncbi:probable ubiquitin carboxyl-terminal hydrolase MINDY-4 [Ornithodoros turicata]|uniref:probable ubiquitin carboxyl-terminal hydrolase MINDY-4 n=1 Tax=Ornithodoros turicata TaxID=34597 RepID=UPI00313876F1
MLDAQLISRGTVVSATHIEDVSCCIVREYLSRKGLKNTLATMDEELPRRAGCFSARDQLIRAVCMERLVRENKERETPYKALLEMLVQERLLRRRSKTKQESTTRNAGGEFVREVNNNFSNLLSAKNGSNDSLNSADVITRTRSQTETKRPQSARGRRDAGGLVLRPKNDIEAVHKLISKSQQYRGGTQHQGTSDDNFPHLDEPFAPLNGQGDRADAIDDLGKQISEVFSTHKEQRLRRNMLPTRSVAPANSLGTAGDTKVPSVHLPRPARITTLRMDSFGDAEYSLNREGSEDAKKSFLLRSQSAPRLEQSARDSMRRTHTASNNIANLITKTKSNVGMSDEVDDVELSDVTDQDIQGDHAIVTHRLVNFRPITLEEATDIKRLLFGSPSCKFGEEWAEQGFTFVNSNAVPYGLIQKKGGPCGVLAVVQAYLLKELLWPDSSQKDDTGSTDVGIEERNTALAGALSCILWQAGNGRKAVIVNPSGVKVLKVEGLLSADGITETLTVSTFTSKQAVLEYYKSCISKLQEESCSSCVAFLISVLLTHGIERIREEMDERNSCLIGKHSHCNQEMVNLLLIGQAVTNVFNNEVSFGKEEKTVLRGITSPSNIGLLSLYEHYNSCEVGSHYKDPKFPIWLVLSESHFSVLFSKTRTALCPSGRQFQLYYYDGLNKQEEEIKLTIDPSANVICEDSIMTPPLELCIRTRWKGASVSWNDSEPLL